MGRVTIFVALLVIAIGGLVIVLDDCELFFFGGGYVGFTDSASRNKC